MVDDTTLAGGTGLSDATMPEATAETLAMTPEDRKRAEHAKIVSEAKERFDRVATWEAMARQRWMDDYKFANGDADNQYQWPNSIRRSRDLDQRPCLTINKTRQHNLQIINDARQNKPAIKIRATGNGATVESAKVYNAIMRHIEYMSNAGTAYDTATKFQVECGLGWIRIVTEYETADSFNQSPYIRRITDPLTVYIDPDAKEADKSDAKFAFIFEDVPKDEFKRIYPQYTAIASAQSIDDSSGWIRDDHVRIAEYFTKVSHDDVLYAVPINGRMATFLQSDLERDPPTLEKIANAPGVRSRPTTTDAVNYYLIIGDRIAEESIWPGKYIPLIPVIGEETIIQGELDRKGHTRAIKDPQRMYNYGSSIAVEYSSLQTKTPYIAPAEAIEGYETYWEQANRVNSAILPYNAIRDDGSLIPAPERVQPPVPMPAALSMMQTSATEMMMVSGQYADMMGDKSNERSAKAINERQRQGDTATYHYIDNLAVAIREIGKQLLDLVPRLYDTTRVMNIMAEDGTSFDVEIDPRLQQAMQIHYAHDMKTIQRVLFNPNVGHYEVQADIGPAWGTKRAETANALSILLTQAPQLTPIVGDILMQNLDFEAADEAASRLRRMVPPQALGLGPSITEQQLQAQVSNLTGLLQKAMEEMAKDKIKLKGKDALRDIDSYKAISQRLSDLVEAATKQGIQIDQSEIRTLVNEAATHAAGFSLEPVIEASAGTLESAAVNAPSPIKGNGMDTPPFPGARRGRDGHWYVRNYANSNQWAVVE